jgi:hypothetical protein
MICRSKSKTSNLRQAHRENQGNKGYPAFREKPGLRDRPDHPGRREKPDQLALPAPALVGVAVYHRHQ